MSKENLPYSDAAGFIQASILANKIDSLQQRADGVLPRAAALLEAGYPYSKQDAEKAVELQNELFKTIQVKTAELAKLCK